MVGADVVGTIGPEQDPAPLEDLGGHQRALAMVMRTFEAGYAACVRDVEAGATMGTLGDWLSEYEAKEARRTK